MSLCAGLSPQRALQNTLLPAKADDQLQLDEVWSFVGHKNNRVWLWFVLCKRTRQIVAWMPGDRDIVTAHDVWAKVPSHYKNCFCFADGLAAYAHVIPPEQLHQQTQKEHTNHLERFNATLRGRVGRLTRKTLSYSKSYFFHITHIFLFIHHYNPERAKNSLHLPRLDHYRRLFDVRFAFALGRCVAKRFSPKPPAPSSSNRVPSPAKSSGHLATGGRDGE